ncbi:MAG: flavoprotein [Verrucomicrobiota bacterium]
MRLFIGAAGRGGTFYLLRLLELLDPRANEVHLLMDGEAKQVATQEVHAFRVPLGITQHTENDVDAALLTTVSRFDAMVLLPCSMSVVGQLAHGAGETSLAQAAAKFLAQRRKFILVPGETPWNLIQARNIVTVLEAGAVVMPASPSFRGNPKSMNDLTDTLILAIMEQLRLTPYRS